MDSTPTSSIEAQSARSATIEQMVRLFGGYRAEWLREQLFDLFTEPSYFPELKGVRPCVLEGGRGTGKTTVLRCLSYEGQFALNGSDAGSLKRSTFHGFYTRVNTNRVTAFNGPELPESQWIRLFAHYVNLDLVSLVLRFLLWYSRLLPDSDRLSEEACNSVAEALGLSAQPTVRALTDAVASARLRFEVHINNVGDQREAPTLSMQGAPIDLLLNFVGQLPQFQGRQFLFLIDEYENLLDYQQRVINTLIKHSGGQYTFKVGVRELGFRMHATLNENEQLLSPADYLRINITEKLGDRFAGFAATVCNERLKRVLLDGRPIFHSVEQLFGSLTEEAEAELLGIDSEISKARAGLIQSASGEELRQFDRLPPLMAYLLTYWARRDRTDLLVQLRDYLNDAAVWRVRLSNYSYALLFTIRKGRTGIRKYYAGWDVLIKLAGANIRYLLELVDQCLVLHLQGESPLATSVSFKTQTEAARAVGKKNLTELEGVSVLGVRLTRLLLGLGRVFQVLAADPEGHTPEANQLSLQVSPHQAQEPTLDGSIEELMQAAVMHLALIRFSGSKPQDAAETKAYDYMIHPIYSAFFEFSYRRKRKIVLAPEDLLGLVHDPRHTIGSILKKQNRSADMPLPDQLKLFEDFYAGSS